MPIGMRDRPPREKKAAPTDTARNGGTASLSLPYRHPFSFAKRLPNGKPQRQATFDRNGVAVTNPVGQRATVETNRPPPRPLLFRKSRCAGPHEKKRSGKVRPQPPAVRTKPGCLPQRGEFVSARRRTPVAGHRRTPSIPKAACFLPRTKRPFHATVRTIALPALRPVRIGTRRTVHPTRTSPGRIPTVLAARGRSAAPVQGRRERRPSARFVHRLPIRQQPDRSPRIGNAGSIHTVPCRRQDKIRIKIRKRRPNRKFRSDFRRTAPDRAKMPHTIRPRRPVAAVLSLRRKDRTQKNGVRIRRFSHRHLTSRRPERKTPYFCTLRQFARTGTKNGGRLPDRKSTRLNSSHS